MSIRSQAPFGSAAQRGVRAPARTLLARYARAWARQALKGAGAAALQADEPVVAAYLEPYAGVDHPLPSGVAPLAVEAVATLFGGLSASDAARVRARLEEEDPVKVEWLHDALRAAGLGERVSRTAGAEIELIEGACGGAPDPLEAWGARCTLALLDPPSSRLLPLERLARLAADPAVDVVLRFPVAELRRLIEYRGSTLADLPPYARRLVEGVSRLLGDPRHGWVIAWRAALEAGGEAAAEAVIVEACRQRLREAAPGVVRCVALRAAPGAGPEYLLLAVGDPGRALLLNEVVEEARGEGWLPWPEVEGEFVRHAPRGELELFGGGAAGDGGRDRVVDTVALAHWIATRFEGRSARLDRVLLELLDTELFVADVRRALLELRRDGRALFRSLSSAESEIAFPRAGGRRVGGRQGAARGRRAADPRLFDQNPDSE